jgi:hypothetical protein
MLLAFEMCIFWEDSRIRYVGRDGRDCLRHGTGKDRINIVVEKGFLYFCKLYCYFWHRSGDDLCMIERGRY